MAYVVNTLENNGWSGFHNEKIPNTPKSKL